MVNPSNSSPMGEFSINKSLFFTCDLAFSHAFSLDGETLFLFVKN